MYNILLTFMHAVKGYTAFFQANFLVLTATLVALKCYGQYRYGNEVSLAILKCYVVSSLTGFIGWLIDYHLCDLILQSPVNPHLHSWWHILMGVGAHYTYIFEIYLRRKLQKQENQLSNKDFLLPIAIKKNTK